VRHFFPKLRLGLDALADGRDKEACTYPLRALVWTGLLMFLFGLSARRRLRYELNSAFGLSNLNGLAETGLESLPHPDTLAYALRKLPAGELARLRTEMARTLLRGRVLERFRLLGLFYLVAVDGTGYLTFSEPHCPHCLTRALSNGDVQYYHPVLEAKLICSNGMVVSLVTEFIENTDGATKQDCEKRAFERLLPRLRAAFPQLSLCLLLDGLYLNEPILTLVEKHHCAYIITFKEGSLPEASREFEALWRLVAEQRRTVADGETRRHYRWVNDLTHGKRRFNAFECLEVPPQGEAIRFRWATNLQVERSNVLELSEKGGRARWKIENEGFNTQKNGGYGLEHAYSEDWTGARNFYFLMQIAHLISQLLVKGALRHTPVVRLFGSLRAFATRLLEAWRTATLTAALAELLAHRCQIRLDDS
jgi:hypothetical protein